MRRVTKVFILAVACLSQVLGDAYCPPCPFADVDENQACKESTNSFFWITLYRTNFNQQAEDFPQQIFSPSSSFHKRIKPPYGNNEGNRAMGEYGLNSPVTIAITSNQQFINGTLADKHLEMEIKWDFIMSGYFVGYGGRPADNDWFFIELDGLLVEKSAMCWVERDPRDTDRRQCWPDPYPCDNFNYVCTFSSSGGYAKNEGLAPYFIGSEGIMYKVAAGVDHTETAFTTRVQVNADGGGKSWAIDNLTVCMKLPPFENIAGIFTATEVILLTGIPTGIGMIWAGLGKDIVLARDKGGKAAEEFDATSQFTRGSGGDTLVSSRQAKKMAGKNKAKLADALGATLNSQASKGSRSDFKTQKAFMTQVSALSRGSGGSKGSRGRSRSKSSRGSRGSRSRGGSRGKR